MTEQHSTYHGHQKGVAYLGFYVRLLSSPVFHGDLLNPDLFSLLSCKVSNTTVKIDPFFFLESSYMHFNDATESHSTFSPIFSLPHSLKLNLTWNAYAKCLMLLQFVRVIEQCDKKHSG